MSFHLDRRSTRRRSLRTSFETLESRKLLSGTTVVTSTADSGPGTLRQAIENADAQPGIEPVEISFDLAINDPAYSLTSGVWTIAVQSALPAITRPGISIIGSTQPVGSNVTTIGTGGTVGVDNLPLTQWSGISVQIVDGLGGGAVPIGLDIQAGNTTILGLSIFGFGSVSGAPNSADIRVETADSGTLISDDLIGTTASGLAPSSLQSGAGNGVSVVQSGSGEIENSLIAYSQGDGVNLSQGSNQWYVQGNEIRGNGTDNSAFDGIDVEGNSGHETITGNLVVANWANGIDTYQSSGGNLVFENTIDGNGIGPIFSTADAGLRLSGELSLVKSNVIDGNYGAGVQDTPGATGNTITQNSIDDNGTVTNLDGAAPTGQIGIDVQMPGDDVADGTAPFLTPNDPSTSRDGIDGPVNFPVFSTAQIQNGLLTISGFARPGSTIELFLADPASNGFGQGTTYLATFVTGSSNDTGVGTGSYGPFIDGVYVGQDTTNHFQFSIPTPLGVNAGSSLTATATLNGSTSEFGPLTSVTGSAGSLFYQAPSIGPDAITLRQDESDVEIVDNGSVVAREPMSLTTMVSIVGDDGGLDQFTLDDTSGSSFVIPGGIIFQGGDASTSPLTVLGDGQVSGTYVPDPATSDSGQVYLSNLTLHFGTLGSLALRDLSSLTLQTPDAGNIINVESPAVGQNEFGGSSGGVAFAPVTFSSTPSVSINTAINDAAGSPDAIEIGPSGLVAASLENFSIATGSANQTLSILSPILALPVGGGSFSDDGGSGQNTLIASADSNYTLGSNSLTIPGQGSIALSNIQDVQLTGGPDSTQFNINNWAGGLTLDGGPGMDTLSFFESGSYGGSLALSDFTTTSIQVQGNFSGQITTPTSQTIQSILIGGDLDAVSSIIAGSFVAPIGSTTPAIVVGGDDGGTIIAVEDPDTPGSGVLSSIEIGGSLLATTGAIGAGAIGTIEISYDLAGQITAKGAGTIGTITVGGNLSGTVDAPEDPNPGSGTISSVNVNGTLSGTVSSGTISNIYVGGDLAGTIIAQGAGTIGTITVGGNLSGTVDAPEDPNPGSGTISSVNVNGTLSGTVSSGTISNIYVGGDLAGTIIAQGAGTIGTITVGGNLSGTVYAPEDTHPGSGTISSIIVDGNLTGTVSSGTISNIYVGGDLAGTIIAQGAGTIGTITVGGNLSGTVDAPEDPNPGSGTISSVNVNGTLSGTVSSGTISNIYVGGDLAGIIIAKGAGSIGNVEVDGNLDGSLEAALDSHSTSGVINSLSVKGTVSGIVQAARQLGSGSLNAVGTSGSILTGNIVTGLTVVASTGTIVAGDVAQFVGLNNVGGSVSFQGITNLSVTSLSGSLQYSASAGIGSISIGVITTSGSLSGTSTTGGLNVGTLQGRVSLGNAGSVEYTSLAPGSELDASSIDSLTIDQNSAGTINVSGNLHQLLIPSGSVLLGSLIEAGSLDQASIGQDMAGQINVSGTLGQLAVGGSTSGTIVAGTVGTISAGAGAGPYVLQVEEHGIERNLVAATPDDPYPQPGDSSTGTLAKVSFRYLYESAGLANPQLTVQVTNASGDTQPDQFDLSLETDNDIAKFNLSRLDSNGPSGLRNVTVEGDILTSVSAQATAFFGGDLNAAGIRLPLDDLAGVAVRDFLPTGGYIQAAGIQAIAAGQFGRANGSSAMGSYALASDATNALAPGTAIDEASNTFRVPFADQPNLQVGVFLDDMPSGGFDRNNVAFTVQSVVAVNAAGTANVVTRSNAARGADIALIQVAPAAVPGDSTIESIEIQGDGASISTKQWISGSITSSGSLGDLQLDSSRPVADITAASIFGTITSFAPFVGTIQTTGLRTDPISGVVSSTAADLGRTYLNALNQLTTTQLVDLIGTFSGNLLVRGNLTSALVLNGGFTGTIATEGNIGVSTAALGMGGITINGNDDGQIVSLGQILGNVTVNGSLNTDGTIAAESDILGNTTIKGNLAAGANIVSHGVIGFLQSGTLLTIDGSIKGLIASDGALSDSLTHPNASNIFASAAGTPNEAAIDAIFGASTAKPTMLKSFDKVPGSLDRLELDEILTNLANLHIDRDGKLSIDPGT